MVKEHIVYEDFTRKRTLNAKAHAEKYTPEGRRWVNPGPDNVSRSQAPYAYSAYYLWGVPEKGHETTYSDRLSQWNRDKFAAATKAVNVRFENFTRQDAEAFLTAYYDAPIDVSAFAQCCNVSSGYPIWIFFHSAPRPKENNENTTS